MTLAGGFYMRTQAGTINRVIRAGRAEIVVEELSEAEHKKRAERAREVIDRFHPMCKG